MGWKEVAQMGPIFFKSPAKPDLNYTERQLYIISELISLKDVGKNELTAILKKARARGDQDICDYVEELLCIKDCPPDSLPLYPLEEAKRILQRLTPWKILWDAPCKY